MKKQTEKMTITSMFIALGTALGYSLAGVPNIELVTATVFIGGYVTGWKNGAVIGFLTESIYAAVNPFGIAAPPLFISMVLAMACTGIAGGLFARIPASKPFIRMVQTGAAGAIVTFNFAAVTTFGYLLFAGFGTGQILTGLITGLGFYLTHIISNFLIFILVVPVLIHALDNFLYSSAFSLRQENK